MKASYTVLSVYRVTAIVLLLTMFPLKKSIAESDIIDVTQATILEINRAIDNGQLSSEDLVKLYLARIEAYDQQGPSLNTILHLNPDAVEQASQLDVERQKNGRRSPLHGIPILIKDNIDTADMPTTAGSFMLKGSMPPDDAQVVTLLKEAGAIILGKLNLSEFASGGPLSSLGGPILNPHHLGRSPAGSSGGTGAAIAARFSPLGLGTDTGGSVRGPSTANGIVGLKTTHGLVSTDGVIPLALSFDTIGPMANTVEDMALLLSVIINKAHTSSTLDYTSFLNDNGLQDKKIGVVRSFTGDDNEVDWVFDASLHAMEKAGAELIEITFPEWLMASRGHFYRAIRFPEFKVQIESYLKTLDDGYPKSLDELIDLSMQITAKQANGVIPNPPRWSLMKVENKASDLNGFEYQAVKKYALPMIRDIITGLMDEHNIDAIAYPTSSIPADVVDFPIGRGGLPGAGNSNYNLANLSGFPDLSLPIGTTTNGLPINISLLGKAQSEGVLIQIGFALEQKMNASRVPKYTPVLK